MISEKNSADVPGAKASIFAMGDRKKILQLSTEICGFIYWVLVELIGSILCWQKLYSKTGQKMEI
ncbi:MAG: hypothetical protein KDC80_28345 [Saprospiraceae bacterium]|nr:hypothetical protein [Saprospiraceae bacterium]